MARLFLLALLLTAALGTGARGQTAEGEALALALRNHVVSIRAHWPGDIVQDGFGFVVGERGSDVYIVTADHLVRGRTPDEIAESVELTWFGRRGEHFPATLLGTRDDDRDIAVLRATLPAGVELDPDLMIRPRADVRRSDAVWYVGKAREWYVPSVPGRVNSVDLNDQIIVDGLNVQVGTSGAPLIADEGIAGMIVEDSIGGALRATSIGFIERAFRYWAHPWAIGPAPEEGRDAPDAAQVPSPDVSATGAGSGPEPAAELPALVASPSSPLLDGPEVREPRVEELLAEPPSSDGQPTLGAAAGAQSVDEPQIATRTPADEPIPDPDADRPQPLEAELRRRLAPIVAASEVAALDPFDAETGLPQVTIRNLSVEAAGPSLAFASFDAAFGDVEFGRMTARVEPGSDPEQTSVTVTLPQISVALPIEDCVFHLAQRDFSLVWRESLGSFTSADIALGPSRIICADEMTSFSSARLAATFDPRTSDGLWSGTLHVTVDDLLVSMCEGAGCGEEGETGIGGAASGQWSQAFGARTVALSMRFEGANLERRQARMTGMPVLHWPREAGFLAFPLDFVGADSPEDIRRIARYLGDVDLIARLGGVTAEGISPGIHFSLEQAELRVLSGRPALVSYRHRGAAVSGPDGPVEVPPMLSLHLETTGRLDLETLVAAPDGLPLSRAGPFIVDASAEREPSRVDASGRLWVQDENPENFALHGVVEAVEPVALLMDFILLAAAESGGLGADEEAFEAALRDTVDAVAERGNGSDPDVKTFDLIIESATQFASINGMSPEELQRIFEEACVRRGC